jgi:hypothetical protein
MTMETRSRPGELRAVEGEGIIEGYAAVWGTVDSYESSFQRGAFSKTLQERGPRVKILWNHEDTVIGKPLEIREDEKGLFVRAQLVLSVDKAREVYELVKAGAIDTFSFGFRTIKDKWAGSIRVITEVMLMEISPVIFEANSAAVITGVRNMPKSEERAQRYAETYAAYELQSRGDLMLAALRRTLDDVWYGPAVPGDQMRAAIGAALGEFAEMYSAYTDDMIAHEKRAGHGSPLALATREFLRNASLTPEGLAASTSLTLAEVRSLLDGAPKVASQKLGDLPDELRAAVAAQRAARVNALCDELRDGLEPAELDRIRGLLPSEDVPAISFQSIADRLTDFRASLQ